MTKLLIIRFSSFGDIIQGLPAISAVKSKYPQAEIHWLVRSDFRQVVEAHPQLARLWSFDKKLGILGLLSLAVELQRQGYSHIYDAHNNVRSLLLVAVLRLLSLLQFRKQPNVTTRSKNRLKRFLYFKAKLKVLPEPFRGSISFLEPLKKWHIPQEMPPTPQFFTNTKAPNTLPEKFIALVPSAAWPNKRWPVEHWQKLVPLLAPWKLVILGGPQDTFCADIAASAPSQTINLAGQLSLGESCAVVAQSRLTISADTGLLHAADHLGTANIGLIGPTAFGYTSQPQSAILETALYCKPCSKDGRTPCINPVYQKCMKDISPEQVAMKALDMLGSK